jgi:hypothetical protein
MNDAERISNLEKKVKTLEHINYVRFAILALSLLGVTGYVMSHLKK